MTHKFKAEGNLRREEYRYFYRIGILPFDKDSGFCDLRPNNLNVSLHIMLGVSMFMLTDEIKDWKDLQRRVQQIYVEMNYDAEVSKTASLAGRGNKEIDVYVRDLEASYNRSYLVECKHWVASVPQEVVHSFKTVMEEVGADSGFIISKCGFQSGAYEAAQFTNIRLLSFQEFQELYGGEWLRKQWNKLEIQIQRLRQIHDLHFDQFNTLPISNNMFFHTPEHWQELNRFHHWASNLILDSRPPKITSFSSPEAVALQSDPFNPDIHRNGLVTFATAREYFAAMIQAAKTCADMFDETFKCCQASFDALDSKQQSALMKSSLRRGLEELPLRVLKSHLSSEEFERLLSLVERRISTNA